MNQCPLVMGMVAGEQIYLEFNYSKFLLEGDVLIGIPIVVSSPLNIIGIDSIQNTTTKVLMRVTGLVTGKSQITVTMNTQLGSKPIDVQDVFVS